MTHFAQGWDPTWADVAVGKSISNVRDELYWAQVETTPGVYSFPATFENYMAKLKQDNISPLIILSFENPLYDGGNTPYTAAAYKAYGKYGVAVLSHYGSQISALEIWNEYNGGFSKGPATADRAGTYTQMLKEAYTQIKAARPDVTVLGGSTAGTPLPYWENLMKDGALPYMDALSIHPYRYNTPPEGIETEINNLQSLVKQYNNGQTKPIWVTEIGWQQQASPLLVDDATLGKYVTRVYALLLSAGVEKVYWYLLHDYLEFTMGIFNSDKTPKTAAYAMGTLINELAGAPFVAKETTPDNVYSMLFQRTTGEKVRIMWTTAANRPIQLSGVTKAVDMMGNSIGTAGAYTLSDAPIFVEGNVTGVPAPTAADEVLLASAQDDFSKVQGNRGWTYGYMDGNGPFTQMPTYSSDDWNFFWTANYSYLTITGGDMHPSMNSSTPVKVARRWTSNRNGKVHLVGNFQGVTQGDGVGVSIMLNGQPALARRIIGGTNTATQAFDLVENVTVGSTIDFIVDVGPATDMSYDATNFSAQVLTSNATSASVFPDTGAVVSTPPTATSSATAFAPLPGEIVLADANRDFSGSQGQAGWFYGDLVGSSSVFESAAYSGTTWGNASYSWLSLSKVDQHPSTSGNSQVSSVRRWVSTVTGNIHVMAKFSAGTQGDGVGVRVMINGNPVVGRSIIGGTATSTSQSADFVVAVSTGATVDFAVDCGPATDLSYDATTLLATICSTNMPVTVTVSSSTTPTGAVATPASAGDTVLTDATRDFSGSQGQYGWYYGDFLGSSKAFEFGTFAANAWGSAKYSWLSVTALDQHPSSSGTTPVTSVRRWISTYAGQIHIVGKFTASSTSGDGAGATVLLDGVPAMARTIVGGSGAATKSFDLIVTAKIGSIIDFAVDTGPAADLNFDATGLIATISSVGTAGTTPIVIPPTTTTSPPVTTTTSPPVTTTSTPVTTTSTPVTTTTSIPVTTTSIPVTTTTSPPVIAGESLITDSVNDFSSTQGKSGWSYGDFYGDSTALVTIGTYSGSSWMGSFPTLAVSASSQCPSFTAEIIQIAAVRRWTSTLDGNIHVVGSFQIGRNGDGVGVCVLVGGKQVVVRTIIGNSGSTPTQPFDFVVGVHKGDTVDFSVDPGAGRDINGDTTSVNATIYSTTAAATVTGGSGTIVPPVTTTTSPPVTTTTSVPVTTTTSVPVTGETLITDSNRDFGGSQGQSGWSYGDFPTLGSVQFEDAAAFAGGTWSAKYAQLSVTAGNQHPALGLNGLDQVSAVRRWTSNSTGNVHVVGKFTDTRAGDGAGVEVLVNGTAVVARTFIGVTGNSLSQVVDFVVSVSPGSTIDFAVDPGPGRDIGFDDISFAATISSTTAAATTSGGSGPVPPVVTPVTTISAPVVLASGTVLADANKDFSGIQGQNGWTYGDFANENTTTFEAATSFAGGVWTSKYVSLAIAATTQHPSIGANGLDEVAAVRRWTSSFTGSIHVVGSFTNTRAGDGVGVTVLVNGKPSVARRLIGVTGTSLVQSFDLVVSVKQGDTIDFSVDPGPARDFNNDNPVFTATITVQ